MQSNALRSVADFGKPRQSQVPVESTSALGPGSLPPFPFDPAQANRLFAVGTAVEA